MSKAATLRWFGLLVVMPPGRFTLEVLQGTPKCETQNCLEGLYIPCGLGTPSGPSGGAGSVTGKGMSGIPC